MGKTIIALLQETVEKYGERPFLYELKFPLFSNQIIVNYT